MRKGADEMPIGELARTIGVTTATINFYVKEGVLPAPRKISRTRAAYTSLHLRILRLIHRMQAQGYTLSQIRRSFERFGLDESGLARLEGIGMLHPVP